MKSWSWLLCLSLPLWAENVADIDHVDSRIEWAGLPAIKVGEYLAANGFSLGGFVELRDEARFDQGYLPNHQWRGFLRLGYTYDVNILDSLQAQFPMGYQHESAHASMGIKEETTRAYDLIYDDRYRIVNRNAFFAGYALRYRHGWDVCWQTKYLRYVGSRNTPEAANKVLTYGNGFATGLDVSFPMSWVNRPQWAFVVSGFLRQEFESSRKVNTLVHFDSTGGAQELLVDYPVFRATRGIVGTMGLSVPMGTRRLFFYGQYGFGNLGGFYDSRQKNTRVAGGVMFMR